MADVQPASEQRITPKETSGSHAGRKGGDNELGTPLRDPQDVDGGSETAPARETCMASGPQNHITPLWTLKATQLCVTAAYASLAKFLPVFYHSRGVSLTHIGALALVGPFLAFGCNVFWSMVINKTGAFKTILVITQVIGTSILLMQLFREVQKSLALLFVVSASCTAFLCTGSPIIDAMCVTVLEENRGSGEGYGDQRLWSAVGWGVVSLLIWKLIDMWGMWVGFAGFVFFTVVLLTILVWRFPSPKPRGRGGENSQGSDAAERFSHTVLTFDVLWFFTNLLVYGMSLALVENLLLIHLRQDFHNTSNLLLGCTIATQSTFEVPVFKFVDRLWNRCGFRLTGVIAGCQLMLVLRCILYTSLPNNRPWFVLLIEPLHSITFSAMWAATVEYGKRLAPPSHVATMQVVVNALYYFVALAFGGAVWGVVAEPPVKGGIGFRKAFIVDATFVLSWTVVWQIGLQIRKWRVRRQHSPQQAPDAMSALAAELPTCNS